MKPAVDDQPDKDNRTQQKHPKNPSTESSHYNTLTSFSPAQLPLPTR